MANSIDFTRNYTSVIDEVYQRASVSGCLTSGRPWCVPAATYAKS